MEGSRLIIISAPSGAGKTTLCQLLVREFSPKVQLSISSTTRPPRDGEQDGTDYFFLSQNEFQQKIEQEDFAEWAKVHQHLYGTDQAVVQGALKQGFSLVLDIDVQGAKSLKDRFPKESLLFFIAPPSLDELRKRLIKRGTDSQEVIERRMNNAEKEIQNATFFDHRIVNADLDRCYQDLRSIVIQEIPFLAHTDQPS